MPDWHGRDRKVTSTASIWEHLRLQNTSDLAVNKIGVIAMKTARMTSYSQALKRSLGSWCYANVTYGEGAVLNRKINIVLLARDLR